MTIWIITRSIILILRKAILPNVHSLQMTQSNQIHFFHILKAFFTHLKQSQMIHER